MDSFELNKILGAVLATCLVLLITSFAANAIFTPKQPEKRRRKPACMPPRKQTLNAWWT